jgi:hypothetical protein
MNTVCTEAAYGTDAPIIPSRSTLDQVANSTPADEVTEDGDIWMAMPPSSQQPIWPRVWPGL